MAVGIRGVGELCWFNMLTPEPEQARAFFAELLGWTYAGYLVEVGGRGVGALFDLADPRTPEGTPPLIGVMAKVESADAAVEKVRALGGRARQTFDIMDQGRMSVCHDPNGAELDVWEPRLLSGTDVDSALHGAPSWFEVLATDVERAAAFYAGLFGWTPRTVPMPGATYTTFTLRDAPVAGMLEITPRMGSVAPRWVTYFTVNDAEAAARKACELGGTVSVSLKELPSQRFCGITSPQGVDFRVVQYTR